MSQDKRTSRAKAQQAEHPMAGGPAEAPDAAEFLEEDGPQIVFRDPSFTAPSGKTINLNEPNPLSAQAQLGTSDPTSH